MVNGYYPQTLEEALKLKAAFGNDVVLIMGGSDVMVKGVRAADIIFLRQVEELKRLTQTEENLIIGAACTYTELTEDGKVPDFLRGIMRQIASPAVRNVGTVVGNICNASPAGDMLPALYAMEAMVVAASLDSRREVCTRRVPIEDFILGVRRIDLRPEEIVTAVEIPRRSYEGMTKLMHMKVGARKAEAIAKLSFVGIMRLEKDMVRDIRIAFGAVGPVVIRNKDLENGLKGMSSGRLVEKREEIAADYDEMLQPINDQRSTEQYRRKVCRNLLIEFLESCGNVQ